MNLLKYNIDLEPINLKNFLKRNFNANYLTSIKSIDTIHFYPTIYMFQDINDLFVLFYENNNNNNNKTSTRKIVIRPCAKNKTYKKTI